MFADREDPIFTSSAETPIHTCERASSARIADGDLHGAAEAAFFREPQVSPFSVAHRSRRGALP